MLSITTKNFNKTITTAEKTTAQREIIEKALEDALRRFQASGEPVYSLTITSLKVSDLTAEIKKELEESGYSIKNYQPYVGISEYLKIFIPRN